MKNRFLLLLLLLCTLGFVGNSNGQETPHWQSIPITWGDGGNMSLYTTIYIDGVEVNNPNYEIAAFAGEERISKVGALQQTSLGGKVFYSLNVFGYGTDPFDDPNGTCNRFTFKIWDHESNALVEATSTYQWEYVPGAVFGGAEDPLPINFYTQETTWELVTNQTALHEGDILIITNEETTKALGEKGGNNRASWDITYANGTITWEDAVFDPDDDEPQYYDVQEIIYHMDDFSSTYPSLFASKGFFLNGNSGNQLRTGGSVDNEYYLWSITVDANGIATIVAQGANTRNTIRYNATNSSGPIFSCYAGDTQSPIRLYRKVIPQAVPQFTVTATASPATDGSIQLDGADFTEGTFDQGSSISLTAVPATGKVFDHWTIDNTEAGNANPLTVTVNANMAIVAVFVDEPITYYTLQVSVNPTEAGSVNVMPAPETDGYAANTPVTVTATATDDTWIFDEWVDATGASVSTLNPYAFNITANTTLVAKFHQEIPAEPHTVTFVAGSGTCEVTELTGTTITLPTATPCDVAVSDGYSFAGWATAEVPETTEAPALLNGEYQPEADITLYAVYSTGAAAGPGTGTEADPYNVATGISVQSSTPIAWVRGYIVGAVKSGYNSVTGNDQVSWSAPFDLNTNVVIADDPTCNEITECIIVNLPNNKPLRTEVNLMDNPGNLGKVLTVKGKLRTYFGQASLRDSGGTNADFSLEDAVATEATYNTNPSCEGTIVTQDPVITPGSGTITTPTVTVQITCPTEGAVIYYTLDGSTPTAESTVYTAAIEISETTTVSAIAIVEGGEPSNVVTATYTFPTYTTFANIADFKANATAETGMAEITGDITFVFRNGRYMFVQDATGALLIYDNNPAVITNTYANGDVISGGIIGTYANFHGQIEFVPAANPAEGVAGTPVEPTVVTAAEVIANYADYDAKFVKMETVTFTEDHTFANNTAGRSTTFTQGEATYTVYNRFNNLTLTVAADQEGDVTGFIGVYDDTKQIYPRDNEDIELVIPEPQTYTVTVTTSPAEGGDVIDAEGNSVDGLSLTYEEGAHVILTAVAADGYVFSYWQLESLEETVETITYEFDVTSDRSIVAAFVQEEYTVTIDATEGGTAAIENPAEVYHYGDVINLTNTPNEGYHFVNYTVDGTEVTSPYTVTGSVTIVANFESDEIPQPETYIITVSANPTEGGTVSGGGEYEVGASVTVTANANEGYEFKRWTEDDAFVSSNPNYTFTVSGNRELVAVFEEAAPEPETFTITVLDNENGTVTAPESAQAGETVVVTAEPNEGYILTSLYYYTTDAEDVTDIDLEAMSFEMPAANVTIGAEFTEETPQPEVYTITVLPNAHGTITAPATAEAGETITVEATANPLHELSSLYYYTTDPEDVTDIDLTTMQFVMPAANVTIGAVFPSTAELGDVNDDDQVNILDVLAVLNYILGKDPQPFDFEQADMNGDGTIDISDAMAINALILGAKDSCEEMTALYDVVDGMLSIESPVALAGYQFSLSAEPASVELAGFTTMGNWVNGQYIFLVFNLNNEKEAGLYEVLNIGDAQVNHVALATLSGCKVNAERGALSVNTLVEASYNVYPVPATEVVTVEGEGINFIEVFNVLGQRVLTSDSKDVNVSNLSAGTYMFRINTNNGPVMKSVIVAR